MAWRHVCADSNPLPKLQRYETALANRIMKAVNTLMKLRGHDQPRQLQNEANSEQVPEESVACEQEIQPQDPAPPPPPPADPAQPPAAPAQKAAPEAPQAPIRVTVEPPQPQRRPVAPDTSQKVARSNTGSTPAA
jgi:hypothetical protein